MSILENIKQRPDNEKKIFSLITAVTLTLIIVVVWFSFTDISTGSKVVRAEQNKLSSVSPFQVIKDEFSKVFSNFDEKVDSLASTSSTTVPIEVISEDLDSEIKN
jgi:hypothetical protein